MASLLGTFLCVSLLLSSRLLLTNTVGCIVIILFNGWSVFLKGQWNTADFIIAYITIPITAGLYCIFKLVTKSKVTTVEAMDFISNVPPMDLYDYEEIKPTTAAGKIWEWLF